jgi:hypothetical protein
MGTDGLGAVCGGNHARATLATFFIKHSNTLSGQYLLNVGHSRSRGEQDHAPSRLSVSLPSTGMVSGRRA